VAAVADVLFFPYVAVLRMCHKSILQMVRSVLTSCVLSKKGVAGAAADDRGPEAEGFIDALGLSTVVSA